MADKTPHRTKYVATVTVIDPDTDEEVEVELRKDTDTGMMVGLDGAWLDQEEGNAFDPYTRGEELEIPDDEDGPRIEICVVHAGVKCVHCGAVIESEEDGTSSPHGSMHTHCADEHEAQHPEDW